MAFLLSTFTAVTELFVTVAVFAFLLQAYRYGRVLRGLIAFALTYEILVNVAYMVYRLVVPAPGVAHGPGMTALLVFHGSLSLVMLVGLVALVAATLRAASAGRNHLREHPRTTRAFAVLWLVSIGTGEAIYVATYLA